MWRLARTFRLSAVSTQDASEIFAYLPALPTEKHSINSREFFHLLRVRTPRVWIVPTLVLFNICVYFALSVSTGLLGGFDGATLLWWGANYGVFTVNR